MKIDINNVNYVVGDHRTNYIAAIKKYNLEKRKPWKQVKMKFFKIGAHVFSKTFGFTYSSPDGPKIVKDF